MTRFFVLAVLFALLSAPASAAEHQGAGKSGADSKAAQTPPDPQKETKTPRDGRPSAEEFETLVKLKNAKAGFMAAMGACARPGTCDRSSPTAQKDLVLMLEAKELAFMDACQACAAQEKCESERVRIRDGLSSRGLQPCK
jgi:hypothetical protein